MTVHSVTEEPPASTDKGQRILDAAETVFADCGFYNAKVSDIAKQAGVADGTIYLYFKSKDDLLISLFESRMTQVCEAMHKAVSTDEPSAVKIQTFVQTHLNMVNDHPSLAEVLTVELRQSSKFMKEHTNPKFAEYLKILASLIADGQKAGEFDSEVPAPLAARAIFGMVDELALAWLLGDDQKFDIVRAADWVGSLILRGLERKTP
jgi:TetR/AcrR family fatty acid metabolism transcriptional regulator